jgi:hypothetical protein
MPRMSFTDKAQTLAAYLAIPAVLLYPVGFFALFTQFYGCFSFEFYTDVIHRYRNKEGDRWYGLLALSDEYVFNTSVVPLSRFNPRTAPLPLLQDADQTWCGAPPRQRLPIDIESAALAQNVGGFTAMGRDLPIDESWRRQLCR